MTLVASLDTTDVPASTLTAADHAALRRAVEALERKSFASRLAGLMGKQIELAGRLLPPSVSGLVARATSMALRQSMRVAIRSLRTRPTRFGPAFHKTIAAASGAAGGAFGLAALPVELPVSTTVMMRAIAEIARAEGEDLDDPATALACLQVFALGGPPLASAEPLEGGYFAIRSVLARSVTEATRYLAQQRVASETAPVLLRLANQIAARFGLVVSQKLAAQALPILGAVGGAAVNLAFIEHFQSLARGHFTVRRLERTYGPALVREEYARLVRDPATTA